MASWSNRVIEGDPQRAFLTYPANDSEIIAGLPGGKAEAIQALFITYFNRLYSLVYYATGRNSAVAEDIVQETFSSAIKSIGNFKGRSRVYTWLVAIAHHKIADYLRRKTWEDKHTARLTNEKYLQQSAVIGDPSPDDISEPYESIIAVKKALQKLPTDYREVLILKYVEEMSVAEIGTAMKRSRKSIEGLLTRARRIFIQNLKDHRALPNRFLYIPGKAS